MPANTSKPEIPAITDSEWFIMSQFWSLGEATARAVTAALEGTQGWKLGTVQTLINRLVQKKALGRRKEGREFIYRALVNEQNCTHSVSRTFVDRIFGGRLAPLLACFLENEKCSPDELAELTRLIKAKEKQS